MDQKRLDIYGACNDTCSKEKEHLHSKSFIPILKKLKPLNKHQNSDEVIFSSSRK